MRVVCDTNVLFAAIISRSGRCAQVLEHAVIDHETFISQHILNELNEKLRRKTKLAESVIISALEFLKESCALVTPANIASDTLRDPGDLPILGTAVACDADMLITGDKDLLALQNFNRLLILPPREFFDRFCSGTKSREK